ncbi:MAG: amylosucrase [Oscillospiraceae bacterium]|nr:amylosucrase [Oscillospiraceae bacterium]
MTKKEESLFQARLARHLDELRWLYMELYDNGDMFAELCGKLHRFASDRPAALKKRDLEREADPEWYKSSGLTGMMLYIDNFAGDLDGVRKKLPYIEKTGVNLLHLMPFLDTVPGRSDGGYAVADFRSVRPDLGAMEDLEKLSAACHKKGVNLCMDFVMNHTSQDHAWAKKARQGDGEYMSRYFFYKDPAIPQEYEKTVPQVFPTTAPGNFTWLEDCKHWVMTSFYPYQWDLNYRNPRVFNEMMYNFLFLANKGMDMIRIDAVPYIWKELGTDCRNLPQVHTIVRMMRMIGEIVCPSVILLGEVVMEPVKVVPYFGTVEKPECHLLYNVTTMCTTWHTVATRDTRLLRRQLDAVNALPKQYVFLNYLRCHDDIGWGLDYDTLKLWGIAEVPHKKFLSDWFQGLVPDSVSRGELYNADPASGDARQCGTTASLCGVEKAGFEGDAEAMERAVRFDITLHAMVFLQTGLPLLYSGDELAQVNDYSYKDDPNKAQDSRYLHRGKMRWNLAERAGDPSTPEGRVFQGLRALGELRRTHRAFGAEADVWTLDTGDDGVLAIGRYYEGQKIVGVFNFTPEDRTVTFPWDPGEFTDLLTGGKYVLEGLRIPAYGCYYMEQEQSRTSAEAEPADA